MLKRRSSRLLQERDEAVANFHKLAAFAEDLGEGATAPASGSMRKGNRLRFQMSSVAAAFHISAQKHPR
jgi:hypothetical protein